jgi:SAM-dependent methyltransferase
MSREARTPAEPSFAKQMTELHDLGQEIYRSRPDLQTAFADPLGTPYWRWLQTHGWCEYPRVRELSVPVPPEVISQFVNTGDSWSFLLNGAAAYAMLDRLVGDCGQSLAGMGPILDFGCGPGRVLRMMLRHAGTLRVVGTDVDATAIRWCRSNFPFGEFRVNEKNPPTDLPASTFGLVYANSVFSHLAEQPHFAWLRELRRVARPGALLILTVHGRHALRSGTSDEKWMRILEVSRQDMQKAGAAVDSRGFAFVRQPEGHLDRDQFGITFVTEDYVRREWSKEFEVVAYEEAALGDWQDAVVLRRRP